MSNLNKAHNSVDLTGFKFERLTVVKQVESMPCGKNNEKKSAFLCLCDCRAMLVVLGNSLVKGNTKSCGCLRDDLLKARSQSKVSGKKSYRAWQSMLNRCRNPKVNGYCNYGGRGISVCDRWKIYTNFIEDMGEPLDGQSIDRINVDGNYEPANCRWASGYIQSRNKRDNRVITHKGEAKILKDWATALNIDQSSLRERLEKWTIEEALTTPKQQKRAA